ncbi:MAG: helix-turn-helix domain-containing protein [Terracidiphilus sp.]
MVETIINDELAGPMEIFLMAAISRGGLNTLYLFQQVSGLEPGSINHVIKELEKAGLLVRSEGAKRGRRAMALTEVGERFLVEEWKKSMDARREIESVLRSATVALLMGDIEEASRFLSESITRRPPLQSHQELETISPQGTPINFHTAMRTFYLNQRRTMEIGVLERFAENLRRSAAI